MNSFNLYAPSQIKQLIKAYQFRFKKKFGQNFLIDQNILNKIVASAEIDENEYVIEVGAGLGVLTNKLAHYAKTVISFEIDNDLINILQELNDKENIRVIEGDALIYDWDAVLRENSWRNEPVKMVANLPYYLTSPLIMKALEGNVNFDTIVVMIQKEVAERIIAKPGTKSYGILTLAVQYYAQPSIVTSVAKNVFYPMPDVDSVVLKLKTIEPPVSAPPLELFKVIRAAFGQRRKTIKNTIGNLCKKWQISSQQLESILEELNIPKQGRGETLDLQQFSELTEQLLVVKQT